MEFLSESKPESFLETSFAAMMSRFFSVSFLFAYASRFSVSAAKPAVKGRCSLLATSAMMSGFLTGTEVGDRGAADEYVGLRKESEDLVAHLRG